MKPKQILFLVIAFAVLGALYVRQKAKRPQATQGLGYTQILDRPLTDDALGGFKCYLAGQEDQAVHVAKKDGRWVVESRFGAEADESKVTGLLDQIKDLRGERRSSSKEVLDQYGLEDESVLHLVLLNPQGEEVRRLFLGKRGSDWNQTFVRRQDSNDVYLVRENLRSPFGLYGETNDQAPENKPWLNLTVMKAPKEDLTRIEVGSPYRRLILELQEEKAPSPSGATDAPPIVNKKWVVAEPAGIGAPKESGINRLTGAFASVNASDVVDRGGLEKYGLDSPDSVCTVVTQAGEIHRLFVGNPVPGGGGAHYVRLDDGDLVYKMDRWKLDAFFLNLSELVDLPMAKHDADLVSRIIIEHGDRRFELAKEDDAWRAAEPAVGLLPNEDRIDRILKAVTELKLQDKATLDRPEVTGLDTPSAVVQIALADGEEHHAVFGKPVPMTDGGRFVRIDGGKDVFTITKANWDDVTPAVGDLFDLQLCEFDVDQVAKISLEDVSGTLQLELASVGSADATGVEDAAGPKWIAAGDPDRSIDQQAAQMFLSALSRLSALDLAAGSDDFGKPVWKASVQLEDGTVCEATLGNPSPKGKGSLARVSGEKAVFVVPAPKVRQLESLGKQIRSS